jgi:hypothetical protein
MRAVVIMPGPTHVYVWYPYTNEWVTWPSLGVSRQNKCIGIVGDGGGRSGSSGRERLMITGGGMRIGGGASEVNRNVEMIPIDNIVGVPILLDPQYHFPHAATSGASTIVDGSFLFSFSFSALLGLLCSLGSKLCHLFDFPCRHTGEMHIVSGREEPEEIKTNYSIWNDELLQWRSGPPCIHARYNSSLIALNIRHSHDDDHKDDHSNNNNNNNKGDKKRLFLIGGRDDTGTQLPIEEFHLDTQKWSISSVIKPLSSVVSAGATSFVILVHEPSSTIFACQRLIGKVFHRYRISSSSSSSPSSSSSLCHAACWGRYNEWETLHHIRFPGISLAGSSMICCDDRIYLMGGSTFGAPTQQCWYRPIDDLLITPSWDHHHHNDFDDGWIPLPSLPSWQMAVCTSI